MNNSVQTADVIIIGAGIMGCSAAYYAAKFGLSVIVLDSNNIGHGGSCRNGSSVRQSGRDDREVPIAMFAAHNIWPTLNDELGVDTEYERVGGLRLGFTENHLLGIQEVIKGNGERGLDLEFVDRETCLKMEPNLNPKVLGGFYCETDAHANPMVTTLGFYRAARKRGVRFITGEKVIRINKIRGVIRQVVTANGNVYEGNKVILAAGFGSVKIAATVGVHLPIRKMPNEILVTEKYPRVINHCCAGMDTTFYGVQQRNGSVVYGYGEMSTMQLLHSTPRGIPATTHEIIKSTAEAFMEMFPPLSYLKVIRSWAGWLDDSLDHVAIIGPVDYVPGLIVACGFSGHGFGIGPGVGYNLAELAADMPTSADLSELRFDRFHGLDLYWEKGGQDGL